MRLTHHAVQQFAMRWGGTEEQLRVLVANATPTKTRTPKGQEVWTAGEGGCVRLVIKRDAGKREPICVTVLPIEPEVSESTAAYIDDPPSSPVIDSVPADDAHLVAAAAAVDQARDDLVLADELVAAAKNFLRDARARVTEAKERLRTLRTRSTT